MSDNRRIQPRRDALASDYASLDPSPGDTFEAVLRADLLDVSEGGVGIEMGKFLVPEVGARFKIKLPDRADTMVEVVWRRDLDDGTTRLGLRYIEQAA